MSCHGAGASRCNKARSWRHCLANSCVRKHELVGKVAWFVSGLWYSRIWNSCLFWFCQAGNTEWLWTGGFEKNTPGFSDHVTSRPIIQRAVGLYGFLQSSSQFIWSERCLVQDLVTFFSMVFSLLVSETPWFPQKRSGFSRWGQSDCSFGPATIENCRAWSDNYYVGALPNGTLLLLGDQERAQRGEVFLFFWQKCIQSVQNFYINLV